MVSNICANNYLMYGSRLLIYFHDITAGFAGNLLDILIAPLTRTLIDEITDLYKKFNDVKSYYQASVFNDDQGVLEKYKQIIEHEFFPKSIHAEPPCRISVAKRAIADYKKLSCSDVNLADIMFFYVECGVSFTNDYGDIDERFYNSMASVYVNACIFIHKNNLESMFQPRALAIVTDTSNCGWGFHDYLRDSYDQFFSDFDDE